MVPLEKQIELLRQMKFIRAVEDMIAQRYAEQEMRCPVHLSIGQEATAAAVGLALQDGDKAVSSHRSHAHYLAMGGNAGRMLAEIYGKATGCCGGRGGSMHLTDLDAGFVASTAIVGNSIPVGAGVAMAEKLKNSGAIVVIFCGEGATETGVFAETVNFIAVHQLRCYLFVRIISIPSTPHWKAASQAPSISQKRSSIWVSSLHQLMAPMLFCSMSISLTLLRIYEVEKALVLWNARRIATLSIVAPMMMIIWAIVRSMSWTIGKPVIWRLWHRRCALRIRLWPSSHG